jgi:hypothetical protein
MPFHNEHQPQTAHLRSSCQLCLAANEVITEAPLTYRLHSNQRHTETIVGRGFEGTQAELLGGLGELVRDLWHHGLRWRRDGHLALTLVVLSLERSPDSERYAGVLEVDEERLPVRRERGTGELGCGPPHR